MRTRRRSPQSARRQAKPSVFDVQGFGGVVGKCAMDEIRLPQHIVNRIERRWESRFAQTLGDLATLYHPPLGITIHFDHRKFGGCWRDPCGRRLCSLGNSRAHRLRLQELSSGSRVARRLSLLNLERFRWPTKTSTPFFSTP